ncbi:MAG: aminoacyl-tRNA hydrolase [Actinomycetota bacterium]
MFKRSPARDGDTERILVVGLGNPGKQYARTRHNVGAEAIEVLAGRLGANLKVGRDRARTAEVRISGVATVLAVPTTWMNESGEAVGPLARRFKISDPSRIVVVHDELDLEPGTVKLKLGGGLAGHNGLRSISRILRTDDYARVRIGVGKPRSKEHGADHVLSSIPSAERAVLDVAVATAADAIERIVTAGIADAMQDFNGR